MAKVKGARLAALLAASKVSGEYNFHEMEKINNYNRKQPCAELIVECVTTYRDSVTRTNSKGDDDMPQLVFLVRNFAIMGADPSLVQIADDNMSFVMKTVEAKKKKKKKKKKGNGNGNGDGDGDGSNNAYQNGQAAPDDLTSTLWVGDTMFCKLLFPPEFEPKRGMMMHIGVFAEWVRNKKSGLALRDKYTGIVRTFWKPNHDIRAVQPVPSQTARYEMLRPLPASRQLVPRTDVEYGGNARRSVVLKANMVPNGESEMDTKTGDVVQFIEYGSDLGKWTIIRTEQQTNKQTTCKLIAMIGKWIQYNENDESDLGHTSMVKLTCRFDEPIERAFGICDPDTWRAIAYKLISACPMIILGREGEEEQADFSAIVTSRQTALREQNLVSEKISYRGINVSMDCFVPLASVGFRSIGIGPVTWKQVSSASAKWSFFKVKSEIATKQNARKECLPRYPDVVVLSEMSVSDEDSALYAKYDLYIVCGKDIGNDKEEALRKMKGDLFARNQRGVQNNRVLSRFAVVGVHQRTRPETKAAVANALAGLNASDFEDTTETKTKMEIEVPAKKDDGKAQDSSTATKMDVEKTETKTKAKTSAVDNDPIVDSSDDDDDDEDDDDEDEESSSDMVIAAPATASKVKKETVVTGKNTKESRKSVKEKETTTSTSKRAQKAKTKQEKTRATQKKQKRKGRK